MRDGAKIFVVDDEPELRSAVERLLRAEGLEVAAFESGEAFLAAVDPTAFGCVLLDLTMPGLDGIEIQRLISERGIRLPVVFLTARGGLPDSVRAVKAGAVDFLSKPARRVNLMAAIDEALEQACRWREQDRQIVEARARLDRLTPREREVFGHVIAGRLNKVIADRLGTSEQTVKVHRRRVMDKLGAGSVADLVRFASLLGVEPAS